ncbi:MAG TPA: D-amino acid aminotransferase [Burkholderiaceae bacterium]
MEIPSTPCYLNGAFISLDEARIPVLDRGFIFGDGVYEVVPVYHRRPLRLEQHLDRLERSLSKVRIANPHPRDGWKRILARLAAEAPFEDQTVYVQVTRGVARRDFAFPAGVEPTVFAMVSPMARPTESQRSGGLRAVTLPDARWLHCDIKSTSLLGAVLARQHAADSGADEVIQHRDGYLTEGSASNIWVVNDGGVRGPPRDHLILEGIRYGFLQELCGAAGIPFASRPIPFDELRRADEVMLSAATRELLAIVEIDGRPVGNGRPGPVFGRLRAGYDAAIEAL